MSSNNNKKVQFALQKIKQVSESRNQGLHKKYRTRARQTPSMLHSIGLLGTVSYLFARAGNEEYQRICKGGDGVSDLDRESEERSSYAFYLWHIMEYLELNAELPADSNIIGAINRIANDANLLIYLESVLEPYLIELKSFAEALLESE